MNRSVRVVMLSAAALALLFAAGCNKLKARDQLNKGVQAYKNAKFEEAINRFQNAVALDPSLLNARLYLATAYAQQYVPGRTRRITTAMRSRPLTSTSRCWAVIPAASSRSTA